MAMDYGTIVNCVYPDNKRTMGVPVPRNPTKVERTNRYNQKYKAYEEPDTQPDIIERQQDQRDAWEEEYDFELAN